MYKKIIFLIAASIILVPSIHAFSLRLNVPVSGSYEMEGCSECSPKSGGYSIRGIFGMFCLGYSVGTLDWGYPSTSDITDQKLTANAVGPVWILQFPYSGGWKRNFRHSRG